MRAGDRSGPDPEMVAAARAGDEQALDRLVAQCLPLVYNIVGRALDGNDDVDDVVQETLLRVVRGLAELRDPAAFRSWLVAIAVRQVRDREQARKASWHHQTGLDAAELIPDPASDFASVTILRLGLTDQRREIAEATRWLDHDDRTLLALWWLEETGDIGRSELADALGLSRQHAAVKVQRMKEQLETSRTVVRALGAAEPCPELRETAGAWDGVPSPLWRKRFARHVRGCDACGRLGGVLLPMDRLLSGLPLLPVPVPSAGPHPGPLPAPGHLPPAAHAPAAHPAASTPTTAPAEPSPAPPTQRTAPHSHPPRRSGAHRGAHRLRSRLLHGPLAGPAAAVTAVAAVAAGALLAVHLAADPSAPAADAAPSAPAARTATSAASTTPAPTTPPKASPTTPAPTTRTPTPKATTRAAVPAAPAAPAPASTSTRKGVGVWTFDGVDTALARSGASWYYTWSTTHAGISGPGFVPMIWGADSASATALAQAKAAGPYLLGFNEPDMSGQANMTVDQALALWPQLESAGKVLGSPAVAYGADTSGGWLDRFMTGARQKGYRVDFITLHWYGGDFTTADAVAQLRSYVQSVYDRYHKPVWLTEFALTDFSGGAARYPSDQQQAAFLTAAAKMLDGLPYLQRYAWFGLPAKDDGPSTGLFRSGPVVTEEGRAFEQAR
ncbi:putative RNA polymerase ECF subfamily sigma factor [Actinacidiphila reveromycinica]|uniref:Putative RNA polymerase ECF subfamily sigma factor n=1 Tax=Actinacidiphila reveromycinica TaxID=659352 RepID=A0A7U3UY18_9ACTN|nr:sigma-70 family RNA polymerase sigma factor [Streptomyces sp. SN-593]BBB00902.1 putative RNA polymerase ECF subfamily sigma factor [Streptomyces sp. SN-593]